MTTNIFNMADTWNAGATTFNAILMNVSDGAAGNPVGADASQLINLQTNATQRFGVRKPHFALGSDTTPFLNMSDIWNTSGSMTGILYNVTNTASVAATSYLMDLQVGGLTKFRVLASGNMLTLTSSTSHTPGITLQGDDRSIIIRSAGGFANGLSVVGPIAIAVDSPSGALRFYSNNEATNYANISAPGTTGQIQLGLNDAASPVAQILSAQSVVAGTTDTAGQDWTLIGSKSTGTGVGGKVKIQVARPASGTGSAQNTATDGLAVVPGANGQQNSVVLGAASASVSDTDGFLYIISCAGIPTGTPTANTGRIPIRYDSTNHTLWAYDGGAWKVPKAAATTVLWA